MEKKIKYKNTYNKLTCLFGHHDYSNKTIKDNFRNRVYLCRTCKQHGYRKMTDGTKVWHDYDGKGNLIHVTRDGGGYEVWHDYDEEGNLRHSKWSDKDEVWKDKEGNVIHEIWRNGYECWKDKKGRVVREKHIQ